MDPVALVLLAASVLVGAATQRITGMGFALVASPLLVLLLGAGRGVSLLLTLGFVSSLLMIAQLWRAIEVRTAVLLFLPALAGIVPGEWVARVLPGPVLSIVIGVAVGVAVLATVLSERARVFKGTPGLLSAGFLSGFMNAIAGIGGPAVVLYALSTGWAHAAFVATIQLYFAGLSVATLAAKGLPQLDPVAWVVAFAALGTGLVLGNWLSRRVPVEWARRLVIVVALAGAVATILKGVSGLV